MAGQESHLLCVCKNLEKSRSTLVWSHLSVRNVPIETSKPKELHRVTKSLRSLQSKGQWTRIYEAKKSSCQGIIED